MCGLHLLFFKYSFVSTFSNQFNFDFPSKIFRLKILEAKNIFYHTTYLSKQEGDLNDKRWIKRFCMALSWLALTHDDIII